MVLHSATMPENDLEGRDDFSIFRESQFQNNNVSMIMGGGNNNMIDSSMMSEDRLSTGLITGGNLVAAWSHYASNHRVDNGATTIYNDDTPSKAHEEFLSAQKPALAALDCPRIRKSSLLVTANPLLAWKSTTPSAARAEFLSSLQKMPPRPQSAQSMVA